MILNINKLEAELLRDAIGHWRNRLRGVACDSAAHRAAGEYVIRRCDELSAKLDALLTSAAPIDGKD